MPTCPIYEVNYGSDTVLRGGTYNTGTHTINPAGGTYACTWDSDVPSGGRVHVVYDMQSGERDYDVLDLSAAVRKGTTTAASGVPVTDDAAAVANPTPN